MKEELSLVFGNRMMVESILEKIGQTPFRPIALETVDKTWIKVDSEADIFVYDRMETACVVILEARFHARANLGNRNEVKKRDFVRASPVALGAAALPR
jgi:hypothetical protein